MNEDKMTVRLPVEVVRVSERPGQEELHFQKCGSDTGCQGENGRRGNGACRRDKHAVARVRWIEE